MGAFESPHVCLCLGIVVEETRTLKKKIARTTEKRSGLVWKAGTRKGMLRSEGGREPAASGLPLQE